MRAIENNFGTTTAQAHTPFFQKEGKQGFFNSGESSSFFNGTQTRGSAVQTSLTIGASNDPLEREADEKADKVVQSKVQASTSGMCSDCAEEKKLQQKENEPEEEKEKPLQKKENRPEEEEKRATASAAAEEPSNMTNLPAPADVPQNKTTAAEPTAQPNEQQAQADPGTAFTNNFLTPIPLEEEGAGMMPPQATATALPVITYAFVQPVPMVQTVPASTPVAPQRADVSQAPRDLSCILMDTFGTPGTLDVFFNQDDAVLDGGDQTDVENFVGTWVAGGLSDDLMVSGFASEEGSQSHNWRLSCNRANAVTRELRRIGIPDSKITTFAHGETTDFDAVNPEPNRRATVTTTAGTGPLITPLLFPTDDFPGRSYTMFGVGEQVMISYLASPSIAAAEHFGLEWRHLFGSGTVTNAGLGVGNYTAGSTSGLDILTLTVTSGPAAGVPLAVAAPQVTAPTLSNMRRAPGSSVCHTNAVASVGFHGEVFMQPTNVSFSGAQWREGTGTLVGFGTMGPLNGRVHTPTPVWMNIGNGDITNGCQVGTFDTVTVNAGSQRSFMGITSWFGFYAWPIEWQYQVGASGPITYMTAVQVVAIDSAGLANISKAGASATAALADPTTAIGGPHGGGVC